MEFVIGPYFPALFLMDTVEIYTEIENGFRIVWKSGKCVPDIFLSFLCYILHVHQSKILKTEFNFIYFHRLK